MAEAAVQTTVRNAATDDVRVIPVELEKRYLDRGWEKLTAKQAAKAAAEQ